MTESTHDETAILQVETDRRTTTSIRVDVGILDTLMTLAGELVLSRNQLLQGVGAANARATEASSQRIDLITSELQEAIMRTRMQPIGTILDRFHRLVREVSRELGKSIGLEIDGNDVELDKNILEAISAPLNRLMEQTTRHRIEPPDEREKAGKNPTGTITVKAFHEAGQVNILITDDGSGSDGILPDDSVTRTIEQLGGLIETEVFPGKGSETRIKLPLTLAIIPSQIAGVGDERFALPQANLEELLRIPASQVKEKIEKVGDAEVVRLRGELLPLLNLAQVLGIQRTYEDPATGATLADRRKAIADRRSVQHCSVAGEDADPAAAAPDFPQFKRAETDRRTTGNRAVNIAVVSAGNYKYGLVVDQLYDSEEIVVKPVGRHLKQCTAYAGATIMGDGKVALILDIGNLAQLAELSTLSERVQSLKDTVDQDRPEMDKTALLTFAHSGNDRFAVPLSMVERIERIRTSDIETIGSRKIVQYRGGALPLYDISRIMSIPPLPETQAREVIVFRIGGRELGLMVSSPLDSIETTMDIDDSTLKQTGIHGSVIINGHTTLLVDVHGIARTFHPEWFA